MSQYTHHHCLYRLFNITVLFSFQYRYQVSLDGTVAAYRLPYLLAGGSLVLKQNSEYYEHFYHDLIAWKHYVPVKSDLSDLVDRVMWAKENDEEAHKIAKAGEQYARTHLLPDHIFCYHTVLLKVKVNMSSNIN